MKKVWKILFILLGILILSTIIFVCVVISEAPQLNESSTTPDGYLTTVLNDDEEVILTLAGTEANRIYVKLDLIPEELQHAFIAIEDSRFYTHHGIDPIGIARAAVKGVLNGFHFSQGASTITQQLLKNNAFSGWTAEDTVDKVVRKIQEQYLALRLETIKDKEWILENYLNTINLGGGTWGVEAASKRYFNKDVSELTLSECAVLAGITKSPEGYNPLKNPEKCRERQILVLKAMLDQGYIDQEQYDEAYEDDVFDRIEKNHTDRSAQIFDYFEDALLESVVADLQTQLGITEEEAWDKVYRGGLTIYSTVDSEIQTACEQVIAGDYYADDRVQASAVVISVLNGSVKGMVGGRGDKEGSLVYNRATDSLRQPGSTIKIVGEYAAAIDTGAADLGTVYDDAPITYSDGTSISNSYTGYRGRTTLHNAIVSSINTIAYQVFSQVGMDTTYSYLQKFGLKSLTEADLVEALALGGTSGGVTNLEMTAAYNAIAAGGIYTEPYYYTRVLDHDGNILLEKEVVSYRVISEETAALLTAAMEDVITRGTGTAAAFDTYPQAGKTGTTNDARDLWMMGYSPYFSCGIWGGYDSNQAQESTKYVKLMWGDLMQEVHINYKYREFDLCSLTEVRICSKCGLLAIDGLCDSTEAGNATTLEAYVPGQTPTASCNCHIRVTLCKDSGKPAGSYCPSSSKEEKIYLKTGTKGTWDEDYRNPYTDETVCDTHTSLWDMWFHNSSEGSQGNGESSGDEEGGFFKPWSWFGF